jgi:nucleoside-diphosphate-sugar epimerase
LKTAQPYTRSKILAERAAWDFIEERKKENLKVFELATINPSFIFGPSTR